MTPFETLQQLRAQYPTPLSPDQRAALLNAVAWTHRADGWGLLDKPSGSNVPFHGGFIAQDILFNRQTMHHYDVLADAEGAATPTWEDDGVMDVSRWVAPIAPDVPTPTPTPTPTPDVDLGLILARLDTLETALHTATSDLADKLHEMYDFLQHDAERPFTLSGTAQIKFVGAAPIHLVRD